jgi:hypothetical protein
MTRLAVQQSPRLWALPGNPFTSKDTGMVASPCADCNYTEFYAEDANALWEQWSKNNR